MKRLSIIPLFVVALLGTVAAPAFAQSIYNVIGNGTGNNMSPRFEIYFRISATEGSGSGRLDFSRTLPRNSPPEVERIYADKIKAESIRYDLATRKFIIQQAEATQVFGNTERGCAYVGKMTVELEDAGKNSAEDIFSVKFTPNSRADMKEGCPRPRSVSWRAQRANGPGITIKPLK